MPAANEYIFVTRWRVTASLEEVFDILADAESLARWWPSVYLEVGRRPDGVVDLYTKGWLPYTLRWHFRVSENDRPHGFSLEAEGDLAGRGVWTLHQDGAYTDIVYDWRVRADKPITELETRVELADGTVVLDGTAVCYTMPLPRR